MAYFDWLIASFKDPSEIGVIARIAEADYILDLEVSSDKQAWLKYLKSKNLGRKYLSAFILDFNTYVSSHNIKPE